MDSLSYKTLSANASTVSKKWHLIDAEGMVVGRLASTIANLIRGKHKAYFSPHVDCGDKVVVINADKVRFTGKKMTQKEYQTYSGYPGGQKRATPLEVLEKKPTDIMYKAVKGMLPGNKLRDVSLGNLYLYAGTDHPHAAQKPEKFEIK